VINLSEVKSDINICVNKRAAGSGCTSQGEIHEVRYMRSSSSTDPLCGRRWCPADLPPLIPGLQAKEEQFLRHGALPRLVYGQMNSRFVFMALSGSF